MAAVRKSRLCFEDSLRFGFPSFGTSHLKTLEPLQMLHPAPNFSLRKRPPQSIWTGAAFYDARVFAHTNLSIESRLSTEITREKEAKAGTTRARRERSHAIPGPLDVPQYFCGLLQSLFENWQCAQRREIVSPNKA